jgi:protein O-GlcNAc transferase
MITRVRSWTKFRVFIALAIFAIYAVHHLRRNHTSHGFWSHNKPDLSAWRVVDKPTTNASWCNDRFSRQYLQNLRDFSTNYCSSDDRDELRCYHSRTAENNRTDSFCILNSTTLDDKWQTFHTQCRPRMLTNDEVARGVPILDKLSSYWYGTGAGTMIEKWVRLDDLSNKRTDVAEATALDEIENPPKFRMLISREGDAGNIWHTFMEIMSMMMTLDVLQLPSKDEGPILSPDEARNGQIVIVDEHPKDPFFNLWKVATPNYKILRRSDLKASSFPNTKLILPLAGGSNPFWQGDWKLHSCGPTVLLQQFVHRVLEFYDIMHDDEHNVRKLRIVLVDRKETRRLVGQEKLIDGLKKRYPTADIQAIDFADHSLRDQIRTVRKTDVLVGIHGAGLTHSIFLEPGSAVIEILPEEVEFKGFENMARQMNVQYFGTKASGTKFPEEMDKGWQLNDVIVDHRDVVKQVDAAVLGLNTRQLI